MNPEILQSPFIQTALPIMFTVLIAVWINNRTIDGVNKRMDDLRADMTRTQDTLRADMTRAQDTLRADMNARFDKIEATLERIERKLDNHEERLVRLEERTSPVGRVR